MNGFVAIITIPIYPESGDTDSIFLSKITLAGGTAKHIGIFFRFYSRNDNTTPKSEANATTKSRAHRLTA